MLTTESATAVDTPSDETSTMDDAAVVRYTVSVSPRAKLATRALTLPSP
jgi:hypothetical protein